MLMGRALAAALVIVSIWLVGFPYLLISSGAELFPLKLGYLKLLGGLPLVAGAAMFGWVTWTFAVRGGGTALPFDPPTQFVTRGLYARVRNPMYLGDLLIILGVGILAQSSAVLTYGVCLWVGLHLLVVLREESRLRGRFGASYDAYCRQVPRWIPRLRATRPREEPRSHPPVSQASCRPPRRER